MKTRDSDDLIFEKGTPDAPRPGAARERGSSASTRLFWKTAGLVVAANVLFLILCMSPRSEGAAIFFCLGLFAQGTVLLLVSLVLFFRKKRALALGLLTGLCFSLILSFGVCAGPGIISDLWRKIHGHG